MVHFSPTRDQTRLVPSRNNLVMDDMDAIEHLYKVLVIGEYGVGKSFYDPLYLN